MKLHLTIDVEDQEILAILRKFMAPGPSATTTHPVTPPAAEIPATLPPPAPVMPPVVEEEKPWTHDDLRAACKAARQSGVPLEKVYEILGATKVDQVPADKIGAAIKALGSA